MPAINVYGAYSKICPLFFSKLFFKNFPDFQKPVHPTYHFHGKRKNNKKFYLHVVEAPMKGASTTKTKTFFLILRLYFFNILILFNILINIHN